MHSLPPYVPPSPVIPAYDEPSLGQPVLAQPILGQPAPPSDQPTFGQPIAGQFPSGQPVAGQPTFGQPVAGGYPQAGYQPGYPPGAMPVPHPSPYGLPVAPVPASPGTNGFAIAALILAICGAFPVALILAVVFAIVALSQARKRGQGGRGMAIASMVVAGFWAVILVGLIALVPVLSSDASRNTPDPRQTMPVPISGPEFVPLDALRPGDCVSSVTEGVSVSWLAVLPCSQPHKAEVIARFNLPAGDYPGADAVDQLASDGCADRLDAYAPGSIDNPDVGVFYYPPDEETWRSSGGRSVICLAVTTTNSTRPIR